MILHLLPLLLFPLPAISIPTILLPTPTGPFSIGRYSTRLTSNKTDPFNAPNPRSVLLTHFFPIPPIPASSLIPEVPGPAPVLRAMEAAFNVVNPNALEKIGRYSQERTSLPAGFVPTVILTPGFASTTVFHSSLIEDLVSHGYRVTAVDHPYDSIVTAYPDGEVVDVSPEALNATPEELRDRWLKQRIEDLGFVMERLNARKVVLVGHSTLGGAAAVDAARRYPGRVFGAINLDGVLFDTRETAGRSILLMESESQSENDDKKWDDLRISKEKTQRNVGGLQTMVWVDAVGVEHWGWTDLKHMGEGIGEPQDLVDGFAGAADKFWQTSLVRVWVKDWVEYVLGKGTGEVVLGRNREGWEDVKFRYPVPAVGK